MEWHLPWGAKLYFVLRTRQSYYEKAQRRESRTERKRKTRKSVTNKRQSTIVNRVRAYAWSDLAPAFCFAEHVEVVPTCWRVTPLRPTEMNCNYRPAVMQK